KSDDYKKGVIRHGEDRQVCLDVVQPVDWVEGENGNRTLVTYSLGNFFSGQEGLYKQTGGIFKFTILKTTNGYVKTVDVTSPQLMPTYVTNGVSKLFRCINGP